MTSLTPEQKQLFAYIDSLMPGSGHLEYNFNDPKQYEFATMMAQLSGDTAKYPGRLKTLELLKEAHEKNGALKDGAPKNVIQATDSWQNMFTIPALGLAQETSTITSNGLATVVGGYTSMNLSLIVQSRASKDIVAHGFKNDFANTLVAVNTDASTSKEIDVTSYLHYSYTATSVPQAAGVVKRDDTTATTGDPIITAPVRTTTNPNNPNALNIGLGRPWTDQGGNSQFDYAWNEPTQDHPVGKIPFVGSVIFNQDISSPLEPSTNFLLNIYVADETGGGGLSLSPNDMTTVFNAFSIDATNLAKLNWDLPPGVSTTDPGNPIVFSNVPWPSDILAYFFCEIDVVLEDGSLASAYVQSSNLPDPDPTDGTLNIMPIDFIWHCLAESTLVTMADGSTRAIQDIVAGDKVQVGKQGETAVVEWTNKGIHKGSTFTIKTADGQELTTSHNHVLMTAKGPVRASELTTQDVLVTLTGESNISSVVKSEYNGLMYNLATTKYVNAKNFSGAIGVFYANGLQVGDVNAQRIHKQLLLNDQAWVKKQVPAYLHTDVESFFFNKKA